MHGEDGVGGESGADHVLLPAGSLDIEHIGSTHRACRKNNPWLPGIGHADVVGAATRKRGRF